MQINKKELRKELVNNVLTLNEKQILSLIDLVHRHDIKYEQNANGLYIELNKIEDETLFNICEFVKSCTSSNEYSSKIFKS